MLRPAVCLVLATALVTTPLKLALAQAGQQEAVSVQQPPAQDGSRLIRVPPVTDRTARLLGPLASEDPFAAIFADDVETPPNPGSAAPRAIPKGAKITIGIVVALVLVAALLRGLQALVCGTEGGCFSS